MRVLVTCPVDQAQRTAKRLRDLGLHPVLAPLTRFEARMDAALPSDGFDAVIVTSANAVRALELSDPGHEILKAPVWCVGAATAIAARTLGFTVVGHTAADVQGLIAAMRDHPGSRWLYLRGEDIATDLKEAFGNAVIERVVYAMPPDATAIARARAHILEASVDAVLLYSARAASLLGHLDDADVVTVCLSEAIAATCRAAGLRSVIVAPEKTEDAMIEALMTACGGASQRGR